MNGNKHDIDNVLNTRFTDEPSANLADRIIHQASLNTPCNAGSSSYWQRFKKIFAVRYPILAGVVCLIVALYLGVPIENEANSSLEHLNEWLSFSSLNEEEYL